MKKQYLIYGLLFILLWVVFIPNKVSAITSLGDYTIENYDINMIVNEDNTFEITEKIEVYFSQPKHRNISKNTIEKYRN